MEFRQEIIPVLRQNLSIEDYKATHRLYNDLKIDLNEQGNENWELNFSMPEYGRILDKKRPFAASASVEDLVKWISYVGLDKFRSIPGYEDSNFIPSQAAERIAWGIVMSKPKQQTRYRHHNRIVEWQWFYRPFFGAWADKRDELLEVYFDKVPSSIISGVRKQYQQAVTAMAKPVRK